MWLADEALGDFFEEQARETDARLPWVDAQDYRNRHVTRAVLAALEARGGM